MFGMQNEYIINEDPESKKNEATYLAEDLLYNLLDGDLYKVPDKGNFMTDNISNDKKRNEGLDSDYSSDDLYGKDIVRDLYKYMVLNNEEYFSPRRKY